LKANFRRRDGFALVELLTVLIIIAVLVAIAVPVYNSTQQTARDNVDEANVRILNSATLQWVLADENNDPRDYETGTLKTELADYLSGWPDSPNEKDYELNASGMWEVK